MVALDGLCRLFDLQLSAYLILRLAHDGLPKKRRSAFALRGEEKCRTEPAQDIAVIGDICQGLFQDGNGLFTSV
ncbi:MAG TPA: hypothetical protein DCR55_09150 [Lentisphaeria bacterium]|jgi:hypothetical protein|nr:hypothetical protein [Lentisphaeria bacterium]